MVIKPFITLCWPPIYFLVKIKVSVTICRGLDGPTPDYLRNDLSLPSPFLHLLLNRTLCLCNSKVKLAGARLRQPLKLCNSLPREKGLNPVCKIQQNGFSCLPYVIITRLKYPGGWNLEFRGRQAGTQLALGFCLQGLLSRYGRAGTSWGDPKIEGLSKMGKVQHHGDRRTS